MPALIIVEDAARNLYNAQTPDGAQRRDLSAVEVEALAFEWRATCVSPAQAQEYARTQERCVELVEQFKRTEVKAFVAPDSDDPLPSGTFTPRMISGYLAAHGIRGVRVTLDHGVLYLDPPLPRPRLTVSIRNIRDAPGNPEDRP